MLLKPVNLEQIARQLQPLMKLAWAAVEEDGSINLAPHSGITRHGFAVGPAIETRRVLDVKADGTPYLDAAGVQQERAGVFAVGHGGRVGVSILSGTQDQPHIPTLLLTSPAPSAEDDTGALGELRADTSYLYRCIAKNTWRRTALNTWAGGGAGDVVGPAGATDHALARWNLATGKLLQDSLVTADDSGSVNIPSGQTYKINNVAHGHAPAGITFAATDKLLGRATAGGGAGEEITLTAAGRALLDDATAGDQRTTLGLGGAAVLAVGTTAGTVMAGNDSRMGYALQLFGNEQATVVDSTTYYYAAGAYNTTATRKGIVVPMAGTITIGIVRTAQAVGSTETSTIAVGVNGDYTTISSAIQNDQTSEVFSNTGLSLPVVAGDVLRLRWVTPAWATNPTEVNITCTLWVSTA